MATKRNGTIGTATYEYDGKDRKRYAGYTLIDGDQVLGATQWIDRKAQPEGWTPPPRIEITARAV